MTGDKNIATCPNPECEADLIRLETYLGLYLCGSCTELYQFQRMKLVPDNKEEEEEPLPVSGDRGGALFA